MKWYLIGLYFSVLIIFFHFVCFPWFTGHITKNCQNFQLKKQKINDFTAHFSKTNLNFEKLSNFFKNPSVYVFYNGSKVSLKKFLSVFPEISGLYGYFTENCQKRAKFGIFLCEKIISEKLGNFFKNPSVYVFYNSS